jgi:hypothetical protein
MTPTRPDLDALEQLVRGWAGVFDFGTDDDDVDILTFKSRACVEDRCDHLGPCDANVAEFDMAHESIASMLNALPALVADVRRLEGMTDSRLAELKSSDALAAAFGRTLDRIASTMGCDPDPDDDADLVEAVRLLVKERDAAAQRAADIAQATVAGIVAWLDDVEGQPIGAGTLRDFGLQDCANRAEAFRELFAGALRAGAWRGKAAP